MNYPISKNYRPSSKRLEEHLKKMPIGASITYEELSAIADVDVSTPKYRFVLEAARRALIKHHDRCLINIRGQGYQIGTADQILSASEAYRKRSFNAALTAHEIVKTIDLTTLTEKERQAVYREQAKSACMLVVYKATENKSINGPATVQIEAPSEAAILKSIIKG